GCDTVFVAWPLRNARARRRRSDDIGPLHPSRCVHSRRRDGVCLFSRTCPQGFLAHLNGGNLAILFCFVFFYLSFTGAGPWSLDALRGNREGQLAGGGRALQD